MEPSQGAAAGSPSGTVVPAATAAVLAKQRAHGGAAVAAAVARAQRGPEGRFRDVRVKLADRPPTDVPVAPRPHRALVVAGVDVPIERVEELLLLAADWIKRLKTILTELEIEGH